MIFFLYGPNDFLIKRKIKEIVNHYLKIYKSGLNLKIFDLEELSFSEFENAFKSAPLLKERKFFILKNPSANPLFCKNFLKKGKKFIISREIIFFIEEKDLKENEFFNFLKEKGKAQYFPYLKGERLKKWIKKEFLSLGKEITNSAIFQLIEMVGADLWRLENEIKKLSASPFSLITKGEIQKMVVPSFEINLFKILDNLTKKEKKKLGKNLLTFLKSGENPLTLLSLIIFQLKALLLVKELKEKKLKKEEIFKKVNLHPFVFEKTFKLSENFSLLKLKKMLELALSFEIKIRLGQCEPYLAISLFLSKFLS